MLTLLLLRHAKSSWDNPALADYDRPLAKRGKKTAPRMGDEISARHMRPDLILCSSAVRARETLALVLPELGGHAPEVVYDDAIYMATPAALLARLRAVHSGTGKLRRVMVVGHNPGLEELAELLVGGGDEDAQELLAEKFPTCALAVLTFEGTSWSDVAPGTGKLRQFLTPARLS